MNGNRLSKLQLAGAVILSGLCWYIAFGLNGDHWYLVWLAPVPILLVAFQSSVKTTFWASFLGFLIGRASWVPYLAEVTKPLVAIWLAILLSLAFAFVIHLTRRAFHRLGTVYALFLFPVFFTAFEWLMVTFSPDGTAASIAYTQSDLIPIIQVASVTGTLGITFMVTFIPSFLALAWIHRNNRKKLLPLTAIFSLVIAIVFLYGYSRSGMDRTGERLTVGLAALDEKTHAIDEVDPQQEILHIADYMRRVDTLAQKGAKLVLLPERAINLNKAIEQSALDMMISTSRRDQVYIVTGYTNMRKSKERNSSLVIAPDGTIIADYDKIHLVKVLEDRFTPGNRPGYFRVSGIMAGTAICKDLDFPNYIRTYGDSNTALLFVPAWDFVKDDWLHSRMAILRGVENGFPMVRTARLGRLTISDEYGHVLSETSSANGNATSLIGSVPIGKIDTFYSRYGDWFGKLIAAMAIVFIMLPFFTKRPDVLQPNS